MNGYPSLSGVGLAEGPVSNVALASTVVQSPAAGSDFTLTVPDAGNVWEIVSIRARLVTSSAVANRVVSVLVKDNNGTEVFRSAFDTAITASLTTVFSISPQVGTVNGGLTNGKAITMPIPDGPYLPRWTISTSTVSIDTGDAWSQIAVWYRQLGLSLPPSEG